MARLSVLRLEEAIQMNPARLVRLYATLGEERAETAVCRAVEELSARAAEIDRMAADADTAGVVRAAERLGGVARQIGLSSLVRVAADVAVAARQGDPVALAATLARLGRICRRSLAAIWDLQGLSV